MDEPSNPDSWRLWFRDHGPRLLLYARLWTGSAADAEDVVQDAFVRFWKHQRHLAEEPQALLFTSVRRAALDWRRRQTRRKAREEAVGREHDGEFWFESPGGGTGHGQELEGAIRRLPEAQQEVLVLKVWGELTFEQIGLQLAVSPATAASRYRYALTALRKVLNPVDDERSLDRA